MAGYSKKLGEISMNCKKCRKEIPDASVFCLYCGARQVSSTRNPKRRGNGQGSVYKRGKVWMVEIVTGWKPDGSRLRHTKSGFRTKNDALSYIEDFKQGRIRRKTIRPLSIYYESWCKSDLPKLSKSKQIAYRIAWRKFADIHYTNVSDLDIIMLRDLVAEEAPTHYPARDMKTLLSHLLKLAIADQQIEINMAQYITLPELNESEQNPWSNDELKIIWSAYDNDDVVAAYLLLMIYTGMMPGELCLCTRSMVHLDERQIFGPGLKTSIRKKSSIVIADFLVPVIDKILTYTEDNPDRKILYTNRDSFYRDYHIFTREYNVRDLPMYSCRHTTATALAIGTDVAPSIIQKIMRHAKFTTTQRYIHPDASDAISGVNKLSPTIP